MDYTLADLAKMIDHSLLQPVLTDEEMERGIRLAMDYDVASVCIKPYYLARCAEALRNTTIAPSTVIGFPHGGHATAVKLVEVKQALADGAKELDMVINIGKAVSGDWGYVEADIAAVTDACHAGGAIVKVIFENCYLNDEPKIRLCEICGKVGADFVKTSTGYGTGGATIEDLKLMRRHSPPHVHVKAAGGVRTLDALLEVRAVGATRCGATATRAILDDAKQRLGLAPSPGS
ncbi:MAG: deoxyribose-phosphate aldolase [Armatimonadetes bacterium]|nr:deoxyribose-phosphate aldolase [Armatimonadota bacterium]